VAVRLLLSLLPSKEKKLFLEDSNSNGVPGLELKRCLLKTLNMSTTFWKTSFGPSMLPLLAPGQGLNSSNSLPDAVRSVVFSVDVRRLRPLPNCGARPAFHPRLMLGLLTFCYAYQIYGSTAIHELLTSDDSFVGFCQNDIPSAEAIRRFRKENRDVIQECLKSALTFLTQRKVNDGTVTRINENFLVEEARRRLIMAAFTDSTN
jgi:transposase